MLFGSANRDGGTARPRPFDVGRTRPATWPSATASTTASAPALALPRSALRSKRCPPGSALRDRPRFAAARALGNVRGSPRSRALLIICASIRRRGRWVAESRKQRLARRRWGTARNSGAPVFVVLRGPERRKEQHTERAPRRSDRSDGAECLREHHAPHRRLPVVANRACVPPVVTPQTFVSASFRQVLSSRSKWSHARPLRQLRDAARRRTLRCSFRCVPQERRAPHPPPFWDADADRIRRRRVKDYNESAARGWMCGRVARFSSV